MCMFFRKSQAEATTAATWVGADGRHYSSYKNKVAVVLGDGLPHPVPYPDKPVPMPRPLPHPVQPAPMPPFIRQPRAQTRPLVEGDGGCLGGGRRRRPQPAPEHLGDQWDFPAPIPEDKPPQPAEALGSAMVLPVAGDYDSIVLHSTKSYPRFLDHMAEPFRPVGRARTRRDRVAYGKAKGRVEIEHIDIYTVIKAEHPLKVFDVLDQVEPAKRPPLVASLVEWIAANYRHGRKPWPVLVFCFNNTELTESMPALWSYKPFRADRLFIPGVDLHDPEKSEGGVPDLKTEVDVDHLVMFGAPGMPGGVKIPYQEIDEANADLALQSILPRQMKGLYKQGKVKNGDFVVSLDWLLSRQPLRVLRALPPASRLKRKAQVFLS